MDSDSGIKIMVQKIERGNAAHYHLHVIICDRALRMCGICVAILIVMPSQLNRRPFIHW